MFKSLSAGAIGAKGTTEEIAALAVKLHRAIPEAGYATDWQHVDDAPLAAEANNRVRVEQRNARQARSSPIWVRPV